MHDLKKDIDELFAEAQHLGQTRRIPEHMHVQWPLHRGNRPRQRSMVKMMKALERRARQERKMYVLSLAVVPPKQGVCTRCGSTIELRPGVPWPVHIGQRGGSRCAGQPTR